MHTPRPIADGEDFPIKPSDINATGFLWDTFGHRESEVSAGYIIRFMQEKGEWSSFTYGELNTFYKKTCKAPYPGNYTFSHLMGPFEKYNARESWTERLDVIVQDGQYTGDREDPHIYRVTDEFILRCYRSAGVPRMKSAIQTVS